jgi:hypothetical protein
MAVTESRPAPHDGEPPAADGPGRTRRHPWRHFQPSLVLHEPSPPSGPGAEPAQDLVCPAGTGQGVSR